MLDILLEIKSQKEIEVAEKLVKTPVSELKNYPYFKDSCRSLSSKLRESTSPEIIAEFKRQSPSKGIINAKADPTMIPLGYESAGAAAVSVLTDLKFFGAHEDDFAFAKSSLSIPLLRKDFIISPYQVYETKAIGADIILLIAAILSPGEVEDLSDLARSLGLDVLLELHGENETDRICSSINLLGINNRNLRSFSVDTKQSERMLDKLPSNIPAIAESGLSTAEEVKKLHKAGFKGFLIGETFMKENDPVLACKKMILLAKSKK
jgi:indole-3-glycerol phosphate synthase